MEDLDSSAAPWNHEYEELSTKKAFAPISLLQKPIFSVESSGRSAYFETSGEDFPSDLDTVEYPTGKRKVDESAYGFFCVMRKRRCRRSEYNFLSQIYAENTVANDHQNCLGVDNDRLFGKFAENAFDLQGADTAVSDFVPRCLLSRKTVGDEFLEDGCYLSVNESMEDGTECSESDVISEHVFKIMHLGDGLNSLESISQFDLTWPDVDEGNTVSTLSSEICNSIFLPSKAYISISEVRNRTYDTASLRKTQYIVDHQVCSSHGNHSVGSFSTAKHLCSHDLCEEVLKCRFKDGNQEISCNTDIFNNDIFESFLLKARHGGAVNMSFSMEKRSIELGLGSAKTDNDIIPIYIAPSVVRSAILLGNCSLQHIISRREEYGVHDGKSNLEISAKPFNVTFQGPSKSQTVQRFRALDSNLLLKEGGPGPCSSMDVRLHGKVSTTENTDTEPALNRLAPYQGESNSEDEICFPDIGAMICRLNLLPDDSDAFLNREEWIFRQPRGTLLRLEQCTRASTKSSILFQGAFAVLCGQDSKHYIKKAEVIIGRSSDDLDVDIDLGTEGYGNKISRHQALVKLEEDGSFSLKNLGKSQIHVTGEELATGQIVALASSSLIDIRGSTFAFKINEEAVRRFLRSSRLNNKDETRFGWTEEVL